jgi:hypothetical protein
MFRNLAVAMVRLMAVSAVVAVMGRSPANRLRLTRIGLREAGSRIGRGESRSNS